MHMTSDEQFEQVPQTPKLHDVVGLADRNSAGDYWYALIDEETAGTFLGELTARTMQGYRVSGNGPPYVRVSRRAVRYRRIDLKRWSDTRLRQSTSDSGLAAA